MDGIGVCSVAGDMSLSLQQETTMTGFSEPAADKPDIVESTGSGRTRNRSRQKVGKVREKMG